MAEIRCPVCDHLNPPDAQNCQSCQAPLKTSAFSPTGAEDLPDWLRDLQGAGEMAGEATGQVPFAEPSGAAELPDWLSGISAEPSQPEAVAPSGAEPDWLADLLKEQPQETPVTAEIPDWLTQEQPPTPSQAAAPFVEQAPFAEPSAAEMPDWLSGLGEAPQAPAPGAEQPAGPAEALPDWLAGIREMQPGGAAGGTAAFIFEEESPPKSEPQSGSDFLTTLPDWVSQVSAEEGSAESGAAEAEPGLAQSALPTWLEAMRPVEAVAPVTPFEDVSSAEAVTAGPLSGLRGVLTAEADAIKPRKPPAYSVKLRVTDEQRARVALLEELLASEDKAKPLPSAPLITPQYIFRLAIALALLLPIVWVLITRPQIFKTPRSSLLPGVSDLYQQVATTPRGAPVLIAFDYEPGFAGEMQAAASAVVEHLLERGAYLAVVSTSPTGPFVAEHFIASLGQGAGASGRFVSSHANLGYLPGGTIGLVNLAASPIAQVLPYTLQGDYVWNLAPLDKVKAVTDFSLVLVLTDNPETARAWIEQVGPVLNQKAVPLLLVSSAQAEPLVRPYYEGIPARVQGLVSGVVGGAAYEAQRGSVGPALRLWDAFGTAMTVSFLVILVGGVAGFIFNLITSTPRKPQKEKKA